MPDYNRGHAAKARFKAMIARGCPEGSIPGWPLAGWVDVGPAGYAFHEHCDCDFGKILCTVEFGDDGDATVTFPDGESVEVNIEDGGEPSELTPGMLGAAIQGHLMRTASLGIGTPA